MSNRKPLFGKTWQIKSGCGTLHITINEKPTGNIFELFSRLGKGGGCASSQCEAIGRLISRSLKHNIPVKEIIKDLSGISCHSPYIDPDGGKTLSCADGISQILKLHSEELAKDAIAKTLKEHQDNKIVATAAAPEKKSIEVKE